MNPRYRDGGHHIDSRPVFVEGVTSFGLLQSKPAHRHLDQVRYRRSQGDDVPGRIDSPACWAFLTLTYWFTRGVSLISTTDRTLHLLEICELKGVCSLLVDCSYEQSAIYFTLTSLYDKTSHLPY